MSQQEAVETAVAEFNEYLEELGARLDDESEADTTDIAILLDEASAVVEKAEKAAGYSPTARIGRVRAEAAISTAQDTVNRTAAFKIRNDLEARIMEVADQ